MAYKTYNIQVVIRLLLIFINMGAIWLLLDHDFENVFFLTSISVLVLFIQIFLLLKFLNLNHQRLKESLELLQIGIFEDKKFHDSRISTPKQINAELNKTINSFKEINSKYQAQLEFIEHIIDNIDVGLISVNQNNKIALCNRAAKNILKINKLNNLSDIKPISPTLYESISASNTRHHFLIDIERKGENIPLSINISNAELLEKHHKFVVLQNISEYIIKTETEAWSKLIKMMNHEIFNSVTPLASLSKTLQLIIKDSNNRAKKKEDLSNEDIADIAESADIIKKRSENLLHFINGFKQLSVIPPPKFERINIQDLFNNMISLHKKSFEDLNISYEIRTPDPKQNINADHSQLEQILINLISNSLHALKDSENPRLIFETKKTEGSIQISIIDNGPGIPENQMDKIFIPFYSTKEGGTGIGLSLSRHIAQQNNAQLTVKSLPKTETRFTLTFNN